LTTPVWTFRPNWRENVIDRFVWSTETQAARDGTESPRASRVAPRRVYEFRVMAVDEEVGELDRELVQYHGDEWYLPIWHDHTELSSSVDSGDTLIPCESVDDREFTVGRYAVVMDEDRNADLIEIANVLSTSVVATGATSVTQDWPAGADVYPAVLAKLPGRVDIGQITAGLEEPRLQFRVLDEPQGPTSEDFDQYDDGTHDLPLWRDAPNWATAVSREYQRLLTRVDFGIGPVDEADRADVAFFASTRDYLLTSREDIYDFRQWLGYLLGRYREFWTPTWTQDLVLTRFIDGINPWLYIEPIDWSGYGAQLNRRDIYIQTSSGYFATGVTASTSISADEERLTLEDIPPTTPTSELDIICWLKRCRLNTDQIEIAYETAEVANVSVDVRSLRA